MSFGKTLIIPPGTNLYVPQQVAGAKVAASDAVPVWRVQTQYVNDPNGINRNGAGNGCALIEASQNNAVWKRRIDWGQTIQVAAHELNVQFTADKGQYNTIEFNPPETPPPHDSRDEDLLVAASICPVVAGYAQELSLLTWDTDLVPATDFSASRGIPWGAREWRVYHPNPTVATTEVRFLAATGGTIASWTLGLSQDFDWFPVPWAWGPFGAGPGTNEPVARVAFFNNGAVDQIVGLQWRIAL